jgi:flavodoxin
LKPQSITLIVSVLYVFIYGSCFCQSNVDSLNNPFGSASNCIGKSLLVNCFISEVGSPWKEEEKGTILVKESQVIEWLKKQGIKWGVPALSFETINFNDRKDIVLANIPNPDNPGRIHAWIAEYVLHAAGYEDIYPLYDSLKKKYNVDNVLFLFFANKSGHDFAQPTTTKGVNFNRENFVEGTLVYKLYWDSGKDLCTGTIMHEMLHLYGAWDMYKPSPNEVEDRVSSLYKNSIMLHDRRDNLSYMLIDPLTAWCIGWSKNYYDWFEIFRKRRK